MSDWAASRREAAQELQRRLDDRKRAESERAQKIIDDFLATAATEAEPPQPLVVKGRGGGHARTSLQGWYLKTDHSAAVATDGNFYVLIGEIGLRERLRGYQPTPTPPPLIVGEGGGDGETIDLADALALHQR